MLSSPSLSATSQQGQALGPRIRKLHAHIGKAHHQAEGMEFSRALLEGRATPLQLAGLLRALLPAYTLLEQEAPDLATALGATNIPWSDLARRHALEHDLKQLAALPATPASAAAASGLEQVKLLARQAPHRLIAHVYVRYGGDLSGGQQLGGQANAILSRHGLSALKFWSFEQEIPALKKALHDGFEQMDLSEAEEEELLDEAVAAFKLTQKLLAELAEI